MKVSRFWLARSKIVHPGKQFGSGATLLTDVTGDRRRANQRTVIVADRREHHRRGERGPVLAPLNGFVMLAAIVATAVLTRDELAEDFGFVAAKVVIKDERGLPADRLGLPVSVDALGGRIPARDQPVDTAAHDGVV